MSVTIRDVAKAAGVSPSTVSRVLNNKGIISEETCEKIAINVSDAQAFANTFFNRMVFGIETAAHQSGYNLIITNATADREGLGSIERLIMGKKIDGILFPASLLQRSFLKALEGNSFPCVVLGRPGTSDLEASWVDIDNEQAGQAAVNHLYSKGYRRARQLKSGSWLWKKAGSVTRAPRWKRGGQVFVSCWRATKSPMPSSAATKSLLWPRSARERPWDTTFQMISACFALMIRRSRNWPSQASPALMWTPLSWADWQRRT